MRRSLVACLLVAALASGSSADDEDLLPVATSLRVSLAGSMVSYTVQYRIPVERGANESITLAIPQGAVITEARVIAPGQHELAFVAADEGQSHFKAIRTRAAGKYARWSVLLEDGSVSITAPAAGSVTLELVAVAPGCFHDDARHASVPGAWAAIVPRELRTKRTEAIVDACGDDEGDVPLRLPSRELAKRPSGKRFDLAPSFTTLDKTDIMRVELATASHLSDVPHDLATAILVDASSSLGDDERDAQRELVAAYLRAAPAGRVQLIAYARRARAVLPGWTTASTAAPRIERDLRALSSGNGSNVDAALDEAARWLAAIKGTRRIVLFTDERVAKRFLDTPALRPLIPAGVLLHVVAVSAGAGNPTRYDYGTFTQLAEMTGGIEVEGGSASRALDAMVLVRPRSIDKLEIVAQDWNVVSAQETSCTETLAEGQGCTWWGTATTGGPITVIGYEWGRRIERVIPATPVHEVELARRVMREPAFDDSIVTAAGDVAHAVSATRSLFVSWGGGSGYGEELAEWACGCDGGGSHTFGTTHSVGVGYGTGARPPPLELEGQLGAVYSCHLGSAQVSATIETTRSEIVDVQVTVAPDSASTEKQRESLAECVAERIWEASLIVPADYPHAVTVARFGQNVTPNSGP